MKVNIRYTVDLGEVLGEMSELYYKSQDKLENETQALGVKIVQGACKEPLRQMCLNAGESPDIIVHDVGLQEKNFGYDFSQHKMVNLAERGVIDPARVTRCALQNSVSVAGTLITSNFAIVET